MNHSIRRLYKPLVLITCAALFSPLTIAGEQLFGTVKGAETLPENAIEFYQKLTFRDDKGQGTYHGINYEAELEYGVSNQLSVSGVFKMLSLETSGLIIDGYLPQAKDFGLKPSGVEMAFKYMFLSPAKDDIGLSASIAYDYDWLDTHSGQKKDTHSIETGLQLQNYMLEGQLVWVNNIAVETTFADRAEIDNLPADFEWPTDPEMEIELKLGSGVSYRFIANWFVSFEMFYETEFETEVGQERWSVFAGPSIHYGDQDWWFNLSWLPQIKGGGEQYSGQQDTDLHLIEKTEQEIKLKVAFNF